MGPPAGVAGWLSPCLSCRVSCVFVRPAVDGPGCSPGQCYTAGSLPQLIKFNVSDTPACTPASNKTLAPCWFPTCGAAPCFNTLPRTGIPDNTFTWRAVGRKFDIKLDFEDLTTETNIETPAWAKFYPSQMNYYTETGKLSVDIFYAVNTSGATGASQGKLNVVQHKSVLRFVNRATGDPVTLPYVALTMSNFDRGTTANVLPGQLNERFYLPKAKLAGYALAAGTPLFTTDVVYKGAGYLGVGTTVDAQGAIQVTYKDVSTLDILYMRDGAGSTLQIDFAAPDLGVTECFKPNVGGGSK